MDITFAKVKSYTIESGKRIVKLLQHGAKTAKEVYPFGFDSQAPEDFTALYMETSNRGESVVVGYVNRKQVAAIGESRMYAVGSSGSVVSFGFARANGNFEINGNQYSAVRFENLQTATNAADLLINAELAKIAAAILMVGGSYIPAPVSTNLTNSKSASVKLK